MLLDEQKIVLRRIHQVAWNVRREQKEDNDYDRQQNADDKCGILTKQLSDCHIAAPRPNNSPRYYLMFGAANKGLRSLFGHAQGGRGEDGPGLASPGRRREQNGRERAQIAQPTEQHRLRQPHMDREEDRAD